MDNGSLAFAYWCPVISLVDPLDEAIYEIPHEIMQRDEFGNIKLSLLPIKDYPFILIFGGL